MKMLAVLLIAIGALLSGCVAYDTPYYDRSQRHGDGDRDGASEHHDRERDRDRERDDDRGRDDRRPDDGRRY